MVQGWLVSMKGQAIRLLKPGDRGRYAAIDNRPHRSQEVAHGD
jgi:hypothetical protein